MKAGLHWTPVDRSGAGPDRRRQRVGGLRTARPTRSWKRWPDWSTTASTGRSASSPSSTIRAQLIQQRLHGRVPAEALDRHNIKVFTANKFQGDERDVILMSLCLAPGGPPGARFFIEREKRLLNVAVSRARAVCHVFGDLD